MNEGFAEVDAKISGWNLVSPSDLQSTLLTDIEPVVIGPDGKLYLLNGHHTFTSLLESNYGASNPRLRQRCRQLFEPDHQRVLDADAGGQGTLIKDDSTGANSGNVTLSAVQTYTGFTYIEAGTLDPAHVGRDGQWDVDCVWWRKRRQH